MSSERTSSALHREVLALARCSVRFNGPRARSCEAEAAEHIERLHFACSAWLLSSLSGTSAAAIDSSNDTRPTSSVLPRLQQLQGLEPPHDSGLWSCLSTVLQWAGNRRRESRALVDAVVQIGATRRRRRPTTAPTDTEAACASAAECVSTWLLHASGLLRLEHVVLGIAASDPATAWQWLATPMDFLLSRASRRLPTATRDDSIESVVGLAVVAGAPTTHEMVETMLVYVIRLAFAANTGPMVVGSVTRRNDEAARSGVGSGDQQAVRSSLWMARRVLEELCLFTNAGFSLPALRLVTQILATRTAPSDSAGDSRANHSSTGRFVVSRDRIAAFLQPQLSALVALHARVYDAFSYDELAQIFAAYQTCLPASVLVQVRVSAKRWLVYLAVRCVALTAVARCVCVRPQIIRQCVFEASGRSSRDVTSPDAAVSGDPTSVVYDALYQLITTVATTDRRDFVDLVLALAHELASDGVQHMDGFALRQGLELVAAVSSVRGSDAVSAADSAGAMHVSTGGDLAECYREWVRDHFAAYDESADGKRPRSDSSATASPTVRRCRRQPTDKASCSLVTTKRHIQFLCAFLLEFDRREYPRAPTPDSHAPASTQRFPVARSDHVAAHLSMMKTHQPQFSTGGLIMDFCSQTRSRYLELLQLEQAAATAVNATPVVNGKAPQAVPSSAFSTKVRNMVRETIQLYRDTAKLSPQLRQWKMFQPKLWKQELVPCCLAIGVDGPARASSDSVGMSSESSDMLAHVAFVHALAKAGLVTVREYAHFLSSAEEWLNERRATADALEARTHKRRRSAMEGESATIALARLQAEMTARIDSDSVGRESDAPSRDVMDALKDALVDILKVLEPASKPGAQTLSLTTDSDSTTSASMQRLWSDGCVRVLEALGVSHVDAFFAYVVPALEEASARRRTAEARRETANGKGTETRTTAATIAAFYVSQTTWSGAVDTHFVVQVCCVGAAAVVLLGEFHADPERSSLPRLLQAIDFKCADRSIDGRPGDDATTRFLRRSHVVKRGLFVSAMLRAVSALTDEPARELVVNVDALLRCDAVDVEFRAFVRWLCTRSTVSNATDVLDRDGVPEVGTELDVLCFLRGSFHVLAQAQWFQDMFAPRLLTPATLEQVIRLEFRYGLALFGDAFSSAQLRMGQSGCSREWLQLELKLIEDLGGFRVVGVEDVIEWLVAETLFLVTGDSDERESVSMNTAVDVLLLMLSDLMHTVGSRLSPETTTNCHDRIFSYYVSTATELLRESGRALPVTRQRRHHGFEILEICARHCDQAGGHTLHTVLTGGSFLSLLRAVGESFSGRFPWPLLQALFMYLMLAMVDDRDVQALPLQVRDVPASIAVQCALAFPRLERVAERRQTSKNGAGRRQCAFVDHLRLLHSFTNQLMSETRHQDALVLLQPAVGANEVFAAEADWTQYQLGVVKLLFRWNVIKAPDMTLQPHVVSSFHTQVAQRVLRALGAQGDTGVGADTHSSELALCLAHEWVDAVTAPTPRDGNDAVDGHFQLSLVHAVAELCLRSAIACRKVLRMWRASSPSAVDSTALFVVLVAIAMRSRDDDVLERSLRANSSLWLNEFAHIALHIHSLSSACSPIDEATVAAAAMRVIAHTHSFNEHLTRVLTTVFKHSVANRVDILDAGLLRRIQHAWPSLRGITSKLQASLVPLEESSEF